MRRADNLVAFMCLPSRNSGSFKCLQHKAWPLTFKSTGLYKLCVCTTLSRVGEWVYGCPRSKPRHQVEVSDWVLVVVQTLWRCQQSLVPGKIRTTVSRLLSPYPTHCSTIAPCNEAILADMPLAAYTVQKLPRHLHSRRPINRCCPFTIVLWPL